MHELVLPCPSIVLLDLALAFNCPTNRADRLHRLLRLNPALLLFALNQYQNFAKTPADSANRLIAWCEEHLLPAMLNGDLLPCAMNPQTNKKNRQLLKRFLRSRSNPSCRKALGQWIKHHGHYSLGGNSSAVRKCWLKTILAKSFRLDQFRVRKIRRKSTLNACLLYTSPSPRDS